jgi:rhodanese-related sulfurtransferase/DNA-binding transcriptional ArsR family regulator
MPFAMSTPCQAYRDAVYDQLARLTRAMAHPRRLVILDLLLQAPRTVEALSGHVGMSVASTSQHLQVLRAARLVETEKRGLYVTYRLADDAVYQVLRSLRELGHSRLAEIGQMEREMRDRAAHLPHLTAEELRRCMDADETLVLDLRPPEEYAAGHVPGAVSIPMGELAGRLNELPRDRRIVAYCRGEYCLMAREAVDLLQEQGFTAAYVDEGVRDLQEAGLAVETSGAEE